MGSPTYGQKAKWSKVDGADQPKIGRQLNTNAKDSESVKGLTHPLCDLLIGFAACEGGVSLEITRFRSVCDGC